MQPKNDKSFFDNRTLIAIALVAIVFFGWQSYLNKKYPQMSAPKTEVKKETSEQVAGNPSSDQKILSQESVVKPPVSAETKSLVEVPEKLIPFENETLSFSLSSKGMAIKKLVLKKYTDREDKPYSFNSNQLFGLNLYADQRELNFEISQINQTTFQGVAQVGNVQITRTMEVVADNYSINNKIIIQRPDNQFKGVEIVSDEIKMDTSGSSLLSPSFDRQEFYLNHTGKEERISVNSSNEKIEKIVPNVAVAGLSSHYFSFLTLDKSEIIPEAHLIAKAESKTPVYMNLVYKPVNIKDVLELNFVSYTGPISLSVLESVDKQLGNVVNFGFFGTIGKWLLITMRWFHEIIPNWGVAIILLTLLVRMLVLPFNITSYKSMKKMQLIQPKMQSLRDRYKDDPTTLNREMMDLMRKEKVNPIGGCLPMLLQMPVFFALYQVFGQSVELYKAPFFGWITDLSLKDPFYILPVLMGVAMWMQQKLTPSTMDPTQAKVMQFIPIVFSLMMISLPSGLTLYIFVSTLFGIIQQQMFMRDKKA